MKEQNMPLTTPEIAALWNSYMQSSATICMYKPFQIHLTDLEIKPHMEEAMMLQQETIRKIEAILIRENFPIPKGFSENDVDLTVPPLFSDLFALSIIYRVGQMSVPSYGTILTKVARTDVVQFFDESLKASTELYKKSLALMLAKGIYDRPPKIPYPNKVEYIKSQKTFLNVYISEKPPLNASELGEIFYAIERNYIGIILLMGLVQVVRDKEVKEYLIKGKKLSEKQVDIFNKFLKDDEQLGNIPVSIEVTDSTISPYSDRLILFLITSTTVTGVNLLTNTMVTSLRKDLVSQCALLILEILKYGNEGLDIMINRGWMEQPPQPINRSNLYK
ncbi:DUF3231 family protein [Bacillus sp. DNRA2]|uniref:DUF3231 family protein n=1 Tax=Bacillus sp. DNRA2 TaxID=2723053 RepID=UPI00145CFAD5|nr:DUF3231 family protein [Bacillus sp. DNRA2]NMD68655.1 DUF3231 family protein [Bacillus sp. DNRA2]